MKHYRAIILFSLILLLGILFMSCKVQVNVTQNNNIDKIDKSSPQKIINEFYNAETNMDETNLKQFFYLSKVDTSQIKLKIKCFKVKRITLDKVIKIENKDNVSVVTCSYSTFFNGIDLPRMDLEVIKLVKVSKDWTIVIDVNSVAVISDEVKQWAENTEQQQQVDVWNSVNAKTILDSQESFDDKNKAFMEQGSKKLQESLKGSSKK